MPRNLVAEAKLEMKASPSHIWKALTDPKQVKQYYFNTDLETDWSVGSPMTFSGEWNDQAYQDLGTVEEFEPERHLSYSHWSPLSGTEDTPENRHLVTFDLELLDDGTLVTLTQDNNDSAEAQAHSQEMWQGLLEALKEHVEAPPPPQPEPEPVPVAQGESQQESQPES